MGDYPEPASQHEYETVGAPARGARVRTLAVDDHGAFRAVLRQLIAAVPGFALVGEACSGEEAVRAAESFSPQLVLMDVVMPGMGGIAAARTILGKDPGVVVVLMSIDDPSLHAGADDLSGAIVCARKQDLCPRQLRQVWETRHDRARASSA